MPDTAPDAFDAIPDADRNALYRDMLRICNGQDIDVPAVNWWDAVKATAIAGSKVAPEHRDATIAAILRDHARNATRTAAADKPAAAPSSDKSAAPTPRKDRGKGEANDPEISAAAKRDLESRGFTWEKVRPEMRIATYRRLAREAAAKKAAAA